MFNLGLTSSQFRFTDHALGQGLFYWCAPSDAKESKRSLITTGFKALHSS